MVAPPFISTTSSSKFTKSPMLDSKGLSHAVTSTRDTLASSSKNRWTLTYSASGAAVHWPLVKIAKGSSSASALALTIEMSSVFGVAGFGVTVL